MKTDLQNLSREAVDTLEPCSDHLPAAQVFARHGLRCTKQRVALYEALAATKAHPTADELYHSVSSYLQGVSLATVYNTLEAFCEVGLAQKLSSPSGSARYDATVDNHLHLRNEATGELMDVPQDLSKRMIDMLPNDVLQEISRRTGFQIQDIRIELVGQFKG